MKKFISNTVKFLSWLLILPISIAILDPFDFYEHPLKIKYNRIHNVRKNNVADWALSEVKKVSKVSKNETKTISIGDSRGRLLISNGFEAGWKGRVVAENEMIYDLSFGGAQLNESFSLLDLEIVHCPNLKHIILSLPIDRLINKPYNRDRIKTSMFNSSYQNIEYLTNINQLSYVLKISQSTSGTKVDKTKAWKKIEKSFMSQYKNGTYEVFNKNLDELNSRITKLIDEHKYSVTIIIPPYEPVFFKEVMSEFGEDYDYYLNAIKNLPFPVYHLQDKVELFYFHDPVHGAVKNGHVTDLIKQGALFQAKQLKQTSYKRGVQ